MSDDTAMYLVMGLAFAFWALVLVAYGLFCRRVARYWRDGRGRSYRHGFLVSVFFTPVVGWLLGMLLQSDAGRLSERAVAQGTMKVCSFCAEPIKPSAILCRYCGREQPSAA